MQLQTISRFVGEDYWTSSGVQHISIPSSCNGPSCSEKPKNINVALHPVIDNCHGCSSFLQHVHSGAENNHSQTAILRSVFESLFDLFQQSTVPMQNRLDHIQEISSTQLHSASNLFQFLGHRTVDPVFSKSWWSTAIVYK